MNKYLLMFVLLFSIVNISCPYYTEPIAVDISVDTGNLNLIADNPKEWTVPNDLEVTLRYSDGSSRVLDSNEYSIDYSNLRNARGDGSYDVKIYYENLEGGFTVVVHVIDSVYKKLANGIDVNILIVGDSIAAANTWCQMVADYLQEAYSNNITLKNISMAGNSSYAGYGRVMLLDDGIEYDLAILCYGQNDSTRNFDLYYESIIYAIQQKYPNCSFISVLESSQRSYTEKIQTIQEICEYYGYPTADTIAAFNNSGYADPHTELTGDGVHLNEKGHQIYFETIKKIIDANVAGKVGAIEQKPLLNSNASQFKNCKFISVDDFTKVDNLTYTIDTSVSGICGLYNIYQPGENKIDFYVDDELALQYDLNWKYSFTQTHIQILADDWTVKRSIKLVFQDEKIANSFKGLLFSYE